MKPTAGTALLIVVVMARISAMLLLLRTIYKEKYNEDKEF
jgi:hypothetical protein